MHVPLPHSLDIHKSKSNQNDTYAANTAAPNPQQKTKALPNQNEKIRGAKYACLHVSPISPPPSGASAGPVPSQELIHTRPSFPLPLGRATPAPNSTNMSATLPAWCVYACDPFGSRQPAPGFDRRQTVLPTGRHTLLPTLRVSLLPSLALSSPPLMPNGRAEVPKALGTDAPLAATAATAAASTAAGASSCPLPQQGRGELLVGRDDEVLQGRRGQERRGREGVQRRDQLRPGRGGVRWSMSSPLPPLTTSSALDWEW